VLVYRDKKTQQIVVICGDWRGNAIDLVDSNDMAKAANKLLTDQLERVIALMRYAKIEQAQIFYAYIDDEFVLVDIQTAVNKLSSPGMVRDIFSKIAKVQDVIKVVVLDDRAIEAIRYGSGSYAGDLIIKPSRFRMFEKGDNTFVPLYLEVRR
jgi:hypothetical protein